MRLTVWRFVLLAALSWEGVCSAEAWKTGPDFERQLDAVMGINWPDNPLRDSLRRLSETQQTAIMLDRNVDPGRHVTVVDRGLPLAQMLDRIADRSDLAVVYLGPVIYLAPPREAARAATVAELRGEEMRRLPTAAGLGQPKACSWQMLAEPRSLVSAAAADYGVRVVGLERIPHDLWPAADFPPLDFAERMTLLLTGFGLTFEWSPDGSAIRLLDIDDSAPVVRNHGRAPQAALATLSARFPEAKIQRSSRGLRVEATYADHLAMERLVRDAAAPPVARNADPRLKRFSIQYLNKPARALLLGVAKDQGWTLAVDPQVEATLDKLISVEAKEDTLEELLSKTLIPLGLDWRSESQRLKVFARP